LRLNSAFALFLSSASPLSAFRLHLSAVLHISVQLWREDHAHRHWWPMHERERQPFLTCANDNSVLEWEVQCPQRALRDGGMDNMGGSETGPYHPSSTEKTKPSEQLVVVSACTITLAPIRRVQLSHSPVQSAFLHMPHLQGIVFRFPLFYFCFNFSIVSTHEGEMRLGPAVCTSDSIFVPKVVGIRHWLLRMIFYLVFSFTNSPNGTPRASETAVAIFALDYKPHER
jgi:hypothetical protein